MMDPDNRWHPKLKGMECLEREDTERMARLNEQLTREKMCPTCSKPVPLKKHGAYCGKQCHRVAVREQDRRRARVHRVGG